MVWPFQHLSADLLLFLAVPVLSESSSVVGSDLRSGTLSSRSDQGAAELLGTVYWVELQRPWAISG